ncbi:MAG: ClpXP protease specificity-enhancing factor [Gammaproteobacteria bacterium]|nr:ClpXP protease specificity-enhancing factor [Gammaproteobacteria bacterium]
MLSKTPYLLRAFYHWIVDSHCTPYLVLDANYPKVDVPSEFIKNGQIILNLSPDAIRDLAITQKDLYFRTCFSGEIREIYAPIQAVISIYAKETGEGAVFDQNETDEDIDSDSDSSDSTTPASATLKIIK